MLKRRKKKKSSRLSFLGIGLFLCGLILGIHLEHFVSPSLQAAEQPVQAKQVENDLLPPSESLFAQSIPSTKKAAGTTRILMYHYVGAPPNPKKDPIGYELTVTPQAVEAQINLMEKLGIHPISMAQVAEGINDPKSIVMTFDDGYEDFYTQVYPILKRHNWTATVYIISGRIGGSYITWPQVRELHDNGIEIGAHTINHGDLSLLDETHQRLEIKGSVSTIETVIDAPVTTFAYPSGRFNATTLSLIQASGLKTAVTTRPGKVTADSPLFELPRIRITPQLTLTQLEDELTK